MDKLDTALLELLEEDARRTPEQIGVLLGVSAAEAKARIEGLESAGVIRGYTVLIDREQLEEETISALIEVKVQPERNRGFDAIAEQLYLFDEVKDCYLMSGAYDLMLIVEGRSPSARRPSSPRPSGGSSTLPTPWRGPCPWASASRTS